MSSTASSSSTWFSAMDERMLSFLMRSTGASRKNAEGYLPYFKQHFAQYGITTPERAVAFYSQIGTESAGLSATRERDYTSVDQIMKIFGPQRKKDGTMTIGRIKTEEEALEGLIDPKKLFDTVYGDRFKNEGEGYRYRGAGLIQLTGKKNYQEFTDAMKAKGVEVDFVANPELVEQPEWATLSALEFWKSKGLNKLADKLDLSKPMDKEPNLSILKKLTFGVNGGDNGLEHRQRLLKNGALKAKELLDKGFIDLTPQLLKIDLNLRQLRSNLSLA